MTILDTFARLLPRMDSPYDDSPLLLAIMALRLIFSVLWIIVTFIFTRILLRKKVFHINVQCLLLVLPISYGVIVIPNTIVQASSRFELGLPNETVVTLQEITDIGLFGTTFNLFAFVFERLIATVLVHRYEHINSRFPIISLAVTAVQWTGASICIACNYAGLLTLLPVLIFVGVEWAISIVMFSALPAISRRAYDKQMRNSNRRYGNRYQSIENIRTALVLNRLVLFLSLAILFLLAYYTAMSYWIPAQYRTILIQLFHVFSVLSPSIACFIVMFHHETLKTDLRQCFKLRNSNRGVVADATISNGGGPQNQIRSISGVNLVVPIEGHHDHYFNSYQQQWQ